MHGCVCEGNRQMKNRYTTPKNYNKPMWLYSFMWGRPSLSLSDPCTVSFMQFMSTLIAWVPFILDVLQLPPSFSAPTTISQRRSPMPDRALSTFGLCDLWPAGAWAGGRARPSFQQPVPSSPLLSSPSSARMRERGGARMLGCTLQLL